MTLLLSLLALLGAVAVGAISPGPSFLFVVRTAVAGSRRDGLAAAAGMGLGAVVFAVLVLLGLNAVLARVAALFLLCKVAGALYLIHVAVCLWRDARLPLAVDESPRAASASRNAFVRALLTQLSNPKAVVVYGSIFAALLPRELPAWAQFVLPALIFGVETGWYAFVAVMLSSRGPRAVYLRRKPVLDRVAGGVLGLLGVKLLLDAPAGR